MKETRISKAKAVQDCKLCNQLSTEIRKLLQDRAEYERSNSSHDMLIVHSSDDDQDF
jgi:hypothetical protein